MLSVARAVWEPSKIEDALKLMYYDVHLDDTKRLSYLPKKFKRFKSRPQKGRGKGKDRAAASKINYDDVEEDEDDDEEEDNDDEEVEELLDAYYTGQQAKNKLKKFGLNKKQDTSQSSNISQRKKDSKWASMNSDHSISK